MTLTSFPMPFYSVPCALWYAHEGEPDPYGNATPAYSTEPDVVTTCVYAPGRSAPDTADDITEGRPYGDRATMTFFLPKDFWPEHDLRDALIACYPEDDRLMSARRYRVIGDPMSYQRANTPGDYSWLIGGVAWLG